MTQYNSNELQAKRDLAIGLKQDEIVEFLGNIIEKDQIFEVRLKYKHYWKSGIFDYNHIRDIPEKLRRLSFDSVYFTPNPLKEEMRMLCKNKFNTSFGGKMVKDDQVERSKWLLIDCDPKRASGISSTDEEKQEAFNCAKEVIADIGLDFAVYADSGNGVHVMYELAGDVDTGLVMQFLALASKKYSTKFVDVDRKVANKGRIWKLYGTKTKKGDDTDERPHRFSRVIEIKQDHDIITKEQLLKMIKALFPEEIADDSRVQSRSTNREWIEEFIEKKMVCHKKKAVTKGDLYEVDCPFDERHKREAYIVVSDIGWSFNCFHNSCSNKTWHDVKALLGTDGIEAKSSNKLISATSMDEYRYPIDAKPRGWRGAKEFPYKCLPDKINSLIHCISDEIQVNKDIVCNTLIGAYSGAVSGRGEIDILKQPLNLYMAIGAPPSSRKSEIFKAIFSPFFDVQKTISDERHRRVDCLKSEIKKLKTEKQIEHYADGIKSAINAKKIELEELQESGARMIIMEEYTYESLLKVLNSKANGGEVLLASSESDILDNINRVYGGRGVMAKNQVLAYLKGYSGEPIPYSRAGGQTYIIEKANISIVILGQSTEISEFMNNKSYNSRGLISRFLFAGFDGNVGIDFSKKSEYRKYPEYDRYLMQIINILNSQNIQISVKDNGSDVFSQYAETMYKEACEPDKYNEHEVAWLLKHAPRMLRIAGLISIMANGPQKAVIGPSELLNACVVSEYYRYQFMDSMKLLKRHRHIRSFIALVNSKKDWNLLIDRQAVMRNVTKGEPIEDTEEFFKTVKENPALGDVRHMKIGNKYQDVIFPNLNLVTPDFKSLEV